MKFKSQVYTQASGSIGGITYGRNRGGMYTRGRGLVVNPNSPAQQAIRAAFGQQSGAWKDLTNSQREAWTTYAANTPLVGALGDPLILTGQQMFIRTNSPLVNVGMAPLSDAPTTFGLTTLDPITITPGFGDPGDVQFDFATDDEWCLTTGGVLFCYASLPVNPSKNFFNGPFFGIGTVLGNTTTPPTAPETLNVIKPGPPPYPVPSTVGQRQFFRFVAQTSDGRQSLAQVLSQIITTNASIAPDLLTASPDPMSKAAGNQPFSLTGTNMNNGILNVLFGITAATGLAVNGAGTIVTGMIDASGFALGAKSITVETDGGICPTPVNILIVA